ncbi:hypothetical protein G3I40_04115 [Streptomyces sp. SID14478]|uniref:hypothetical protein n=1 Tax=Streptomyces sp. SID14478 TaxID=2706073 RepID=UPI0013DCF510|nr:hypothetical protein [Streptomyces sp. SID14478]NEB74419.1 hypothetical protein [Streptomyces sp. SID14478]
MELDGGRIAVLLMCVVLFLVVGWMAAVRRRKWPLGFFMAVLIFNRAVPEDSLWALQVIAICGVIAAGLIVWLRRVKPVPFREGS